MVEDRSRRDECCAPLDYEWSSVSLFGPATGAHRLASALEVFARTVDAGESVKEQEVAMMVFGLRDFCDRLDRLRRESYGNPRVEVSDSQRCDEVVGR